MDMKKNRVFLWGVIASCLLSTSCRDKDLFTNSENSVEFSNNFRTLLNDSIRESWALTADRQASVVVGGEAGKEYTLKVCDLNPAAGEAAHVLYTSTVQGGQTAQFSFVAPVANERVFIVREDAEEQYILSAALKDDSFEASFAFDGTSQARSYRANAVVQGDPFTFEDTSDYYQSTVPAGVKSYEEIIAECVRADWGGAVDENKLQTYTDFKVNGGTMELHLWSGSHTFYIAGTTTWNITGSYSINQAKVYVLPGAKLTFNMASYINDLEIYIAEGATVVYNSEQLYKQTGGGKIYNHGTLNLGKNNFEVNQNAVLYNEGTVNGTNITSKPGDGNKSFFYNFGDLNLTGNLILNSCANFYNEGNVSVGKQTEATQKDIYWINKGHYVTETLVMHPWNRTFYNYCQLLVKKNAHLFNGQFNLMNNSYMEAATAEFDNFVVDMADGAGFNVKGDTRWVAQGDGTYQGFKASGKAYVHLGGTATIDAHLKTLELSGSQLYYYIEKMKIVRNGAETTEAYLKSVGDGAYPVTEFNTAVGTKFSSITPVADGCIATWSTTVIDVEDPVVYSIAFEDLGSTDDFDFNDVVLYVTWNASTKKADVDMVAAGGILGVMIYYDGEKILEKLSSQMLYTKLTSDRGHVVASAKDLTMNSLSDMSKFELRVIKNNQVSAVVSSANVVGQAPQALVIPCDWRWPLERKSILDAYPMFRSWAQGVTNDNWYDAPSAELVVE